MTPPHAYRAGIQYAEVCINLFSAVVLKYPGAVNKAEAMKIAQQLTSAVESIPALEGAKDTLKQVHSALKK